MRINKLVLTALSVAAACTVASSKAAVINFTAGDLLLGFTATGGTGSNQVLMVDLGSMTSLRDSTSNNFSLTNIGSVLETTYGSNWASRTDLYWGAVSLLTPVSEGGTTNGDPDETIYASKAHLASGSQSTAWTGLTQGSMNTAAGQISGMQTKVDLAQADSTNANAAVMNTSAANKTWDNYNPPDITTGLSFGVFNSPGLGIEQTFATDATVAGNTYEGGLDLYRLVYPSTAGGTSTGSYVGSIVIDSSGNVGYLSAVPEPSTYALMILGGLVLFVFRRRRINLSA